MVRPFFEILVVLVRSAERERLVRVLDGDADRCDERDDGRGNEFRPSFILNFTLNIFTLLSVWIFLFSFLAQVNQISCHQLNESISFERETEHER